MKRNLVVLLAAALPALAFAPSFVDSQTSVSAAYSVPLVDSSGEYMRIETIQVFPDGADAPFSVWRYAAGAWVRLYPGHGDTLIPAPDGVGYHLKSVNADSLVLVIHPAGSCDVEVVAR